MNHRWIVFALLLSVSVRAEVAEVGKPFPAYTLADQFGNTHSLSPATRFVVVASEKGVSERLNEWLKPKEQGFLAAHKTEYVSDIEPMPGIITKMFALPKMKKYPFTLLLATEKDFARTYPNQKGKIAVFVLDDNQVLADLKFLDTPAEVEVVITGAAAGGT
jgi:hypothetical protein